MIQQKAADLNGPATIAFANNGLTEDGKWSITKDCSIDLNYRHPETEVGQPQP